MRRFKKETKIPSEYELYLVLQHFDWDIELALDTFNADPEGFKCHIESLNEPGCSDDKLAQGIDLGSKFSSNVWANTGKINVFHHDLLLLLIYLSIKRILYN